MFDFIIVGQGIAGSVVALQLLKRGQRILVIGNSKANSASSIAAGLYNPITGRSMVKTWLAETLFPYLNHFYREAEQTLGAQFMHPMPIFRPFVTAEECAIWQKKAASYPDFIAAVVPATYHQENMKHLHGGIVLQQTGYLDVRGFIKATRTYLEGQGAYLEADFVHDRMHLSEHVHYQGLTARQVIFCEGPQAHKNPFFSTLPFRWIKGELLLVTLQQSPEVIYNREVYVVPQAACQALVGATYARQDLSWTPTGQARKALEARLQRTFSLLVYTVQDQRVGIRPATFDHRPLIGLHPQYPQVGIFNGLGSKGVSLAPYLAQTFADHLLSQTPLPSAVKLSRVRLAS